MSNHEQNSQSSTTQQSANQLTSAALAAHNQANEKTDKGRAERIKQFLSDKATYALSATKNDEGKGGKPDDKAHP